MTMRKSYITIDNVVFFAYKSKLLVPTPQDSDDREKDKLLCRHGLSMGQADRHKNCSLMRDNS